VRSRELLASEHGCVPCLLHHLARSFGSQQECASRRCRGGQALQMRSRGLREIVESSSSRFRYMGASVDIFIRQSINGLQYHLQMCGTVCFSRRKYTDSDLVRRPISNMLLFQLSSPLTSMASPYLLQWLVKAMIRLKSNTLARIKAARIGTSSSADFVII